MGYSAVVCLSVLWSPLVSEHNEPRPSEKNSTATTILELWILQTLTFWTWVTLHLRCRRIYRNCYMLCLFRAVSTCGKEREQQGERQIHLQNYVPYLKTYSMHIYMNIYKFQFFYLSTSTAQQDYKPI